jgi:hypothetical protein
MLATSAGAIEGGAVLPVKIVPKKVDGRRIGPG